MDLDKLLADFNGLVDDGRENLPFIKVVNYVADGFCDPGKGEAGARRFVAAFLYWLISRNHFSPERSRGFVGEVGLLRSRAVSFSWLLKEEFFDQIFAADVEAAVQPFCYKYIASSEGGFGEDYHALFVEGTELGSFLDVEESGENLERIALQIDVRFDAFCRNDKNWDAPCQPLGCVSPVEFSSLDEWVASLRMFKDLADTPEGKYKTRVKQYWALVDAVNGRPSMEVARELVMTYLNVDDSSVQESVWRALRSFPCLLVFTAILENIEELSLQTEWAPTLVDIFDDDLPADTLDKMVRQLEETPAENRRYYLEALEEAGRTGSLHAMQLLDGFSRKIS